MKRRYAVLAAGLVAAAFVAVPASAVAQPATDEQAVVRVVNYHKSDVKVYVYDSDGRRQLLGTVLSGEYEALELPDELLVQGPVQVKVYPRIRIAGLGIPTEPDYGVKSSMLYIDRGDALDFWLEPVLEDSMIRLTRGDA